MGKLDGDTQNKIDSFYFIHPQFFRFFPLFLSKCENFEDCVQKKRGGGADNHPKIRFGCDSLHFRRIFREGKRKMKQKNKERHFIFENEDPIFG